MTRVVAQDLPSGALIEGYRDTGAYTDCFATVVPGHVTQAAFVEAFYTSRLFKLERLVLALLVAKPSNDEEAQRLATGEGDRFAAWTTEARTADQLLVCDYQGLTRSWLMTIPSASGANEMALLFGTVVAPRRPRPAATRIFNLLGGAHRLYARALLRSAVGRLRDPALSPEPPAP